jgi:hypothetical protein
LKVVMLGSVMELAAARLPNRHEITFLPDQPETDE